MHRAVCQMTLCLILPHASIKSIIAASGGRSWALYSTVLAFPDPANRFTM